MSEQKEFELTITANDVTSTDARFTMDHLHRFDHYKPVEVYFEKADGKVIDDEVIKNKGVENKRVKNEELPYKTMPRIACYVFEKQIDELSVEDRENFPVCQLSGPSSTIYGIYKSKEEFSNKPGNQFPVDYINHSSDKQFFLLRYDTENLFSNIIFVWECLKRFGDPDDKMVMKYREDDDDDKHKKKEATKEAAVKEDPVKKYASMLEESKNLIFRGAPGTGKSYLAKEIAAYMVSNGQVKDLDDLNKIDKDQREQVEFVQFHPSYDYTDFVEGLRPKVNDDGTMVFELQDGIFKKFIERARKNESKDYVFIIDEINRGEISKIFGELFFSIDPEYRGPAGEVSTQYSNLHDNPDEKFYIPENVYIIGTMNDIDRSVDSFDFAMRRRFRFVELKADDHVEMLSGLKDKDGKDLEAEAEKRMKKLNNKIAATEGLNENYQIGASYFLKLKTLKTETETETSAFDQLWTDYLRPLLQEYIRGMNDEEGIMEGFANAYGYEEKQANGDTANGDTDDAA